MMNWKEFKDYVECEGVTDSMDIDYIDITRLDITLKVSIHGNEFSVW